MGDAVDTAVPYLPISNVSLQAKALLFSSDPEYKCSNECYFVPRDLEVQTCEEMREADKHLLQTFLNGLPGPGEAGADAWKVCDLVDVFSLSHGPVGKGWSCLQASWHRLHRGQTRRSRPAHPDICSALQLGLHVKRMFDRHNSTALIPASNTTAARIIHANNVKTKDILPDRSDPKRSSVIETQIRQLRGQGKPQSRNDAAVALNGPAPEFELAPPKVTPYG